MELNKYNGKAVCKKCLKFGPFLQFYFAVYLYNYYLANSRIIVEKKKEFKFFEFIDSNTLKLIVGLRICDFMLKVS